MSVNAKYGAKYNMAIENYKKCLVLASDLCDILRFCKVSFKSNVFETENEEGESNLFYLEGLINILYERMDTLDIMLSNIFAVKDKSKSIKKDDSPEANKVLCNAVLNLDECQTLSNDMVNALDFCKVIFNYDSVENNKNNPCVFECVINALSTKMEHLTISIDNAFSNLENIVTTKAA